MARRTVVRLLDDVDGTEATQTVVYGIDGRWWERTRASSGTRWPRTSPSAARTGRTAPVAGVAKPPPERREARVPVTAGRAWQEGCVRLWRDFEGSAPSCRTAMLRTWRLNGTPRYRSGPRRAGLAASPGAATRT